MGLDMYLRAEKYVSGWDHRGDEETRLYTELLAQVGATEAASPDSPSVTVSVTVGYWRKANAIHRWFVENVQEGNDDCGNYYVSRDQLRELQSACQRVLDASRTTKGVLHKSTTYTGGVATENYVEGKVVANPEVAQEHLPTQAGFFFGRTDYDEWYLDDLRSTIAQIDRALTLPKSWSFEYHSSW